MSRDHRDRPGEELEDAPITPAEQARAEAFGNWLDGLAAGDPLPPAMDSEDRALLETATMVLASSHAMELPPERTRRLVDQALEGAMVGRSERPFSLISGSHSGAYPRRRTTAPEERAARSSTELVGRRRADRVLRHLPWAVASLAAAAAVVLFVTRPVEPPPTAEVHPLRPLRLTVSNTSRPADPLIGPIAVRDAGRASERLDVIFADRLNGYRDLQLRRTLGQEQP
jgi:hypothetical protein